MNKQEKGCGTYLRKAGNCCSASIGLKLKKKPEFLASTVVFISHADICWWKPLHWLQAPIFSFIFRPNWCSTAVFRPFSDRHHTFFSILPLKTFKIVKVILLSWNFVQPCLPECLKWFVNDVKKFWFLLKMPHAMKESQGDKF